VRSSFRRRIKLLKFANQLKPRLLASAARSIVKRIAFRSAEKNSIIELTD
jgi:hypothetical protein